MSLGAVAVHTRQTMTRGLWGDENHLGTRLEYILVDFPSLRPLPTNMHLHVQCDAIRWEHFCGDVVSKCFEKTYRGEDNIHIRQNI